MSQGGRRSDRCDDQVTRIGEFSVIGRVRLLMFITVCTGIAARRGEGIKSRRREPVIGESRMHIMVIECTGSGSGVCTMGCRHDGAAVGSTHRTSLTVHGTTGVDSACIIVRMAWSACSFSFAEVLRRVVVNFLRPGVVVVHDMGGGGFLWLRVPYLLARCL